jgi:hypothetical protein
MVKFKKITLHKKKKKNRAIIMKENQTVLYQTLIQSPENLLNIQNQFHAEKVKNKS